MGFIDQADFVKTQIPMRLEVVLNKNQFQNRKVAHDLLAGLALCYAELIGSGNTYVADVFEQVQDSSSGLVNIEEAMYPTRTDYYKNLKLLCPKDPSTLTEHELSQLRLLLCEYAKDMVESIFAHYTKRKEPGSYHRYRDENERSEGKAMAMNYINNDCHWEQFIRSACHGTQPYLSMPKTHQVSPIHIYRRYQCSERGCGDDSCHRNHVPTINGIRSNL